MDKRIVSIFICTLFLFSALPTVTGTNHINKIQESLTTIKNDNLTIKVVLFEFYYGRIINNGEEDRGWYGICYNVTPIYLVHWFSAWPPIMFIINLLNWPQSHHGKPYYPNYEIITQNPYYIPKDFFKGYVDKNYIFVWYIDTFELEF